MQSLCNTVYMYVFCFIFVKRPCIATTALHCAQGFTLVQNKSCMNLLFLLTWIIHMSIHILFQSARKKLRWQSEFCSKKAIHTASKCLCGASHCMYRNKQEARRGHYYIDTVWKIPSPSVDSPPFTLSCSFVSRSLVLPSGGASYSMWKNTNCDVLTVYFKGCLIIVMCISWVSLQTDAIPTYFMSLS